MIVTRELAAQLEHVEARRQLGYAQAHRATGGDAVWLEVGGGVVVSTGERFPVNRGFGLGLNQPLEAVQLDTLEEVLQARGFTPELDLCPLAATPDVLALLSARGYAVASTLNMYALDLETNVPSPPQTTVEHVTRIKDWLEYALKVWDYPTDAPMHTMMRLAFHLPGAQAFAWRQGDTVQAIGAVQLGEVATLYSGGTALAARGQGAQAALLHERLRVARASGARLATSSANPGTASSRNLERAGFRLMYTKLRLRQSI
jgi:hypothetical protein